MFPPRPGGHRTGWLDFYTCGISLWRTRLRPAAEPAAERRCVRRVRAAGFRLGAADIGAVNADQLLQMAVGGGCVAHHEPSAGFLGEGRQRRSAVVAAMAIKTRCEDLRRNIVPS